MLSILWRPTAVARILPRHYAEGLHGRVGLVVAQRGVPLLRRHEVILTCILPLLRNLIFYLCFLVISLRGIQYGYLLFLAAEFACAGADVLRLRAIL